MPKRVITGEDLCARLASNLIALRRKAGMTQQQVADAAGLDLRHYNKVEHAENNVCLSTIVRLASGFGVTAAALFAPLRRRPAKHTKRIPPALLKHAGRSLVETPGGTNAFEERFAPLLARRVPLDAIVIGRAYVVHARNGGVGVAVREEGTIGYVVNREKWGHRYLFTEYDWTAGEPFGTAIPLRALDAEPPEGQERLLAWLAEREAEHKAEIQAAWEAVLGKPLRRESEV